jgi:preprotein translocase subunit YajC
MEELQGIAPLILFFVLMFAAMYFLMIRPQRKRQKEQEQLLSELRKGAKVVTTGGIHGQVESVGEETVVLKIESGATMRVSKASVISREERPAK